MADLFHRPFRLSMRGGALAAGVAALLGIGIAGFAQQPETGPSPYPGRWTVATGDDADADAEPVSERGLVYRTFDMAPCGKDLCGISVAADGTCGETLFQIAGKHAKDPYSLNGRTRWGKKRKNLAIFMVPGDTPEERGFELYIGDGHDFGERSSNIPKYYAYYTPTGEAHCVVTPS